MPGRLESKVAIVTGGGSGFGQGIATKFVQEGAKVIIADIAQDNGSRVAKELGCEFHLSNVTKREDWEALLNKVLDTHGRLDIVINNAGGTYMNKACLLGHFQPGSILLTNLLSLPYKSQTKISTSSSTST
jgi:NAD(P)-dependent dehydrogenase (short-subunit alcohol dehydrogenase family)